MAENEQNSCNEIFIEIMKSRKNFAKKLTYTVSLSDGLYDSWRKALNAHRGVPKRDREFAYLPIEDHFLLIYGYPREISINHEYAGIVHDVKEAESRLEEMAKSYVNDIKSEIGKDIKRDIEIREIEW